MVELMIVLVIIGILATLLIPQIMENNTKTKFGEVPSVFSTYDHAQVVFYLETSSLAVSFEDLSFSPPSASQWFDYDNQGGGVAGLKATTKDLLGSIPLNQEIARTTSAVVGDEVIPTHAVLASAHRFLHSFPETFN